MGDLIKGLIYLVNWFTINASRVVPLLNLGIVFGLSRLDLLMWVRPQLGHIGNPEGDLDVCHFAIFEPIDQNLTNFEWLLSLKIN